VILAKLAFVVTTTSRAALAALGQRAGTALGCTFAPHQDHQFDRGEALAASVLGLRLTLSHDPDVAEGDERLYVLEGWLRDDLDAEWDADAPVVDIRGFVHGVLTLADPGGGWVVEPALAG
jgi:hypothetical protein